MKTSTLAVLVSALMVTPVALLADHRTDRQTEDAIKDSYTYRVTLDKHVKVDVDNGVATLTGKVEDEEQSRIAEDTAAESAGVHQVVNKIKIAGDSKRGSDGWIAMKVRSRLLAKANVSFTSTKVDVRDGTVYLTGTADSTAQKDLTEEYVKDIDGVRNVKNDIQVVDRNDKDHRDHMDKDHDHKDRDRDHYTAGEKIDDSSITAQVKYELFSHKSTSALKTKVNTHEGHVTISGDANNDAEKALVTKLAKSVRGVESVDNNMDVRH